MVKTKLGKIMLVPPWSGEAKEIIVKFVKGVKKRDILCTLGLPYWNILVYVKTKTELDNTTDIWELIKDDKNPVFFVFE